MPHILSLFATLTALLAFVNAVQADAGELEMTVTYRERIALPPDAQLEVQLLDRSRSNAGATRIASQRFAMTGVPMNVVLHYDPQVVADGARYVVVAEIWSGDDRLFEAPQGYPVFEGSQPDATVLVLSMVPEDSARPPTQMPISGVEWAVTDILGEPWGNDDPATLVIDAQMAFGMFGGCNRFSGQLVMSGSDIAFPDDFAGTLMACPPDTERLERRFLDALRGVTHYVRNGAELVLTDGSGRVLLRFTERPE